ncbi:hypothetical protein G5B37_02565 [Rasiella rasia]|uniref:Uncharacterized protein n=1 Tax=Rasiella rasia TaxID=2744027 RepID=A0A6G6GIV1_9FLAO|nr:hypothetical protein [Rasiella rasia]QIE58479.1 hypothetical protein G5B37_02565 [Rasiella rasia]
MHKHLSFLFALSSIKGTIILSGSQQIGSCTICAAFVVLWRNEVIRLSSKIVKALDA